MAPQDQPSGGADTDQTARALGSNPLLNLKVDCNGAPCDPTFPTPMPSATSSDGAAWVASYGTVKSPTGLGGKPPTREAAKLIEAGKAAAAPNAASSYERGMAKAKDGDSDGAIRDFSEAIRIDANFGDAYVQRGNALFKNGNPELAIADFQNAIQIDARNAAALKARGMARLYNADEEGALDDLSKAIQIAESEPARLPVIDVFFARRTRTSIYSRRRIGDRELFDLSAMIDAYWKNPDLADALKVNYGTQGATSLMATIYRQRAALYVQRANTDGAIADLSYALQLDPARALQLVMERARVQDAAGRREQAAADFKRVLQINPRVEEAKQAIARLNARP
jgi:tetratricopeptide (TPR) repeat protein